MVPLVLKKELEKAGLQSSFLQRPTKNMQLFAAAVNALVTTSMGVTPESQDRLAELLQMQGGEQSDDDSADEGEEGHTEASHPPDC